MSRRSSAPTKIVLGSAGHRPWLFEWFKEALHRLGISGEVIALGHDPRSPGFQAADRGVVMPPYNSDSYQGQMTEWFASERPSLFLSLNDYEHVVLADGLAREIRRLGCAVGGVAPGNDIAADKYVMASELSARGIQTPATRLGSESRQVARRAGTNDRFVVKHRFGSGSSGIQIVGAEDLPDAVACSMRDALNARGISVRSDPDLVVVQDFLSGSEHGIYGVFSVDEEPGLLGVLAQRKIRMRHGGTDCAVTVDAAIFDEGMRTIGTVLGPRGIVNVDVIVDEHGTCSVIDINPRFGGGYPFMHLAGADVPSVLVQSALGLQVDGTSMAYDVGVTSARLDSFTVVGVDGVSLAG